ncbi:vWA domain-containing protein [Azospira inquinata]|uniref:VWA domain-containing protein n=1 Tax=Azospira inquinata TaxID=2785627 RepID=A0A975XUC4_9RHOO|nr:VWA domain-containing protein [Azospira inquinata]QWT46056.1 VWA domain-containing protein [Azospira inquinata]QWT48615.1 VWA domain-containing protein [Azospira inquinata]
MLTDFLLHLRRQGLPVSTTELLTLLAALEARLIPPGLEDFYHLARLCLVKDESRYDRFDQAFASYFKATTQAAGLERELPEDWLRLAGQRLLSEADKARLEKLGWERLMATLAQRLAEQKARHAGGAKWIGTGGTSPFGHGGYHPEGVRIGGPGGQGQAVKVWEKREFRNLDDQVELDNRNLQLALRRLRRFAREGAAEELDMDATLKGTARQGGLLDIRLRPVRRNGVKVLLCLDVGGSMDAHVARCAALFSACRLEFKHLEHFYFHNCVYERLWRDNRRRRDQGLATLDLIHTYGPDYRLIFVGDGAMSPYELTHPHGSVEHLNPEAGQVWLQRLLNAYPRAVWLNPEPPEYWSFHPSNRLIRQLLGQRMFPLSPAGLEAAIRCLK